MNFQLTSIQLNFNLLKSHRFKMSAGQEMFSTTVYVSNTTAVTALLPGQGRKVPQKMFDDYLIQPRVSLVLNGSGLHFSGRQKILWVWRPKFARSAAKRKLRSHAIFRIPFLWRLLYSWAGVSPPPSFD